MVLEVIHDTPCNPLLTSWITLLWMSWIEYVRIINSSNTCGYSSCSLSLHINTSVHGMFVVQYVEFWHLCFKQEDQFIEWMTKGQAMVLRINVLQCNEFVFKQHCPFLWEKTGSPHLALVGLTAGWQADEIRLDFAIIKNLYRLNYLDFYFVNIIAMLLIVLEVHFILLFSNKAYYRVCFVVCKIRLPFFHVTLYY